MTTAYRPRYTLRTLFVAMTAFGVWLGIAVALSPYVRPRETMSLGLSTLPIAFLLYAAYDARPDRGASVGILTLAAAYAAVVAAAIWRSWIG